MKKVWEFITNPNNQRTILIVVLIIAAILFLKQCNTTQSLRQENVAIEKEATRVQNNLQAKLDTVSNKQLNDTTWFAEKRAMEIGRASCRERV